MDWTQADSKNFLQFSGIVLVGCFFSSVLYESLSWVLIYLPIVKRQGIFAFGKFLIKWSLTKASFIAFPRWRFTRSWMANNSCWSNFLSYWLLASIFLFFFIRYLDLNLFKYSLYIIVINIKFCSNGCKWPLFECT